MSNDILVLTLVDGTPRIDSRLIAAELGVEHKNTRELIQKYLADFEEFGKVPFETEASGKTNQQQKFALLNEDQSYLLLTYAQNTEQARYLKMRLVRSFAEYRNPQRPQIQPIDSIDLMIQQHQVMGHALMQIKEQGKKVDDLVERVEVIEAGHDAETQYKVQVYDALMQIDPKSGVRVWRLRMRERMRQIGMTQTRLAVMLGLSQSSVNHYIHDNRRPTLETLERIALSLGLTLAELLSPRFDTDAELDLGGAL